jgi:CO dehydrogenase/acetyl-CoA synthase beta subunit
MLMQTFEEWNSYHQHRELYDMEDAEVLIMMGMKPRSLKKYFPNIDWSWVQSSVESYEYGDDDETLMDELFVARKGHWFVEQPPQTEVEEDDEEELEEEPVSVSVPVPDPMSGMSDSEIRAFERTRRGRKAH